MNLVQQQPVSEYREEVKRLKLLNADLLEALKDALHCINLCSSADEFPEIEKARAAVAKAEGRVEVASR